MEDTIAVQPSRASSVTENIIGIIRQPRVAFTRLKGSSDWALMLGLISLLSMATAAVFLHRFDWQSYTLQALAKDPSIGHVTPEQLAQIIDRTRHTISSFTYISSVLSPVLSLLALAGIYLGAFRYTMKADISYLTSLEIVVHAWVPIMIKSLLAIIMLIFSHPAILGAERIVPSNLGYFSHHDPSSAQFAMLSSIDVFSLWALLLMIIGFSAAIPKAAQWKVAVRVAALWILLILIRGLASIVVELMRATQQT